MNQLVENKLILTISEDSFDEYWVGYINNRGERVFKVANELEYVRAIEIFKDLNVK